LCGGAWVCISATRTSSLVRLNSRIGCGAPNLLSRRRWWPYPWSGIIRERDERFALELATRIIEKPRASAWIILLPFLFIFHVYWLKRYENNVQTFVSQYLHPKILALDAALEESMPGGSDRTPQEHADRLPDENADELRRREFREMELLKEHYRLLLSSRGSSYPSLLRNAYRTSGEYRFFLNRLIKPRRRSTGRCCGLSRPLRCGRWSGTWSGTRTSCGSKSSSRSSTNEQGAQKIRNSISK
jgi:hypothetical protein